MNMHSPVSARFQRMIDWLAHARGCKRRAHEYKRWALEDEAAGRPRAAHYRKQSDYSWRQAWNAIRSAKLERSLM
jgi:ligand-binding sensor domain-containing protein